MQRLTVSKPVLKLGSAHGFQRMKLQYHETVSNFAFKFNLRRYTAVFGFTSNFMAGKTPMVGRSRLKPADPPWVESALTS